MRKAVEFHPASKRELAFAIDYLNDKVYGLGFQFSDEVEEKIQRILSSPELYAFIDSPVR